jgi:hypothetical protein
MVFMSKRGLTYICAAAASVGVVLILSLAFNKRFIPLKIIDKAADLAEEAALTAKLNAIYDVNFIFDKSRGKSVGVYIPEYTRTDPDKAAQFADIFGLSGPAFDSGDNYVYGDGEESLLVDKYSGYIDYTLEQVMAEAEPVDDEAVIAAVGDAVKKYGLGTDYDSVDIERGDGYNVRLAGRVSGLPDYAFPCILRFDAGLNLTRIQRRFFGYERIAGADILTMKEAYRRLPTDYPQGTAINLDSCQLVYMFDDSVVQPAYLFKGESFPAENPDGEPFRAFVKAAKY